MSEEQKPKSLDIERRVEISLAVQRYLRAAEQFEEYYQETLEREQRLDDINERLKADIAELDKENGNKRTD